MTFSRRSTAILPLAYAAVMLIALLSAHVRAAQLPPNFVVHNPPVPVASIKFEDEAGHAQSLADFSGKVVVLNVWATWCVPCRREMPTLDRLQAALGGPDFEVVPVSIDRGGIDTIRKFYADISVRSLGMYADTSGDALRAVGALGLPTTLIINRRGQEVARIVGPAEWDSTEIMEFLRSIIAQRIETNSNIIQIDQAHIANTHQDEPGALQRGLQWLKTLFGK